MALTDKLTSIADAIRAKTGKSATMSLDEMPTEIASISGGGLETATVNITFSPDSRKEGAAAMYILQYTNGNGVLSLANSMMGKEQTIQVAKGTIVSGFEAISGGARYLTLDSGSGTVINPYAIGISGNCNITMSYAVIN